MNQPTAKVIADSISPEGKRITTLEVVFHRFILAEFNTHRAFSRSFRSSRAVPVQTLIKEVTESPWMPVKFGQAQPGMVSGKPIKANEDAKLIWKSAADSAVEHAKLLLKLEIHKEQVNRLLEPYLPAVGVVTATEWENFFALRIANDAAPEMQALARAMKNALDHSTPAPLQWGEWHLPFINAEDRARHNIMHQRNMSAARCARTSYGNHDLKKTRIEETEMAARLWSNDHLSPFEHQATPAPHNGPAEANFKGWFQYRHWINHGQSAQNP